ncbi:hypothetical protein KQI42_03035 [Tissierella sp. MSJ-40]|uniref:ABC-type glycine betaine transport system substrate-binding domain-containing protein n=1 Tax=Tissierella simiarum TaxID=2841534 RepID=A0ABS6E234_9FIRM|nr:glycine betaine ABC transporter substrate-binding protein [Tissierella simiarum]MBU5436967.1 hypothetical protein [Tissierella simiarum]
MDIRKLRKKLVLGAVMLILSISLAACGSSSSKKIVVGGKDFTEQDILVNIVSELIEAKTDIKVDRKPYLGGSSVVTSSLQSGDVDIMVDYTGTGLVSVLKEEVIADADEAYRVVKERYDNDFGIKWLEPLGFNNTFAITMRKEMADEIGIETISQLKDHAKDLSFASTQEFLEREDGYDSMKEIYGIEFKDVKAMDPGLAYTAIKEEQVDISVSFATDGRIPAFGLKILEDDKNFFPPYDAAILVRNDILEEYSELEDVLNSIAGKLTDEEMAKLNAQVDLEKKDSKQVAKQWLVEKGII